MLTRIRQRKRARNREGQRIYRQRKQKHIECLERRVADLKQKHERLGKAHAELVAAYHALVEIHSILERQGITAT
jgi:hypothetical protein